MLSLRPWAARAHPGPMTARTRRTGTLRIAALAYPGVQILDVTGPLEVFSRTSRWLKDHGKRTDDAYRVEIIGVTRGAFRASSGLRLYADHRYDEVGAGLDTLLIPGGWGIGRYFQKRPMVRWIRRQARSVRRLASVCTGAYFLAEAGLLDGLRATTHWASCAELARRYPGVSVEPDTIFVRDVALAVARELVMFLRRPGGQSQFSAQLKVQLAEHVPLQELQAYILEHPEADLSVPALARRVAMSPRNFARAFAREVGMTPARFVASARIETARRLLEETSDGLEAIVAKTGLGTAESMRRLFLRHVGVAPGQYRERFSRSSGRRA